MLKIIMIRHGETMGTRLGKYISYTDEDLLEEEKKKLAMLQFPKVAHVYSSPMKRCINTAKILYPDDEITTLGEFRECNFGLFEGKTYQELLEDGNYKSWLNQEEITSFPKGEDRSTFQKRSILGFNKIVRDAVSKDYGIVAMVVHGGNIMSILDYYGFPKRSYKHWALGNAAGYRVRLRPELFLGDVEELKQVYVDEKMIREDFY